MMISLTQTLLALAEGLGLALSPCILPVLPLILAGAATGSRSRPLQIVSGFILSFTLFSLLSRRIFIATGLQQDQIQWGAFLLLLVLGLIMLVPKLEEKFSALTSGLAGKAQNASSGRISSMRGGGFIVGGLIGLVWTPCAGPIMAAALLQVIQAHSELNAAATIAAFSIGAGLPMLAIGYFGQALTQYIRALSRRAVILRRAMGVVIIAFSLMGLAGFNPGLIGIGSAGAGQNFTQQARLIDGLMRPYAAPEITGIVSWLNAPALEIKDLKGKAVLVDFWTYSCINCIRTLPYVTGWYEKYKDDGFVVIGVHTPEFAFEGEKDNVARALKKFGITYPVAMDNDFATWKNYKNRYWPAHYLIDREGRVVYTHFGEGNYDITENNIRFLLGLNKEADLDSGRDVIGEGQTPETYLGTKRAAGEADNSGALDLHQWVLGGSWKRSPEYIESAASGDTLRLHYRARKVFIVMESADGGPKEAVIHHNGSEKTVTVSDSRLYEVVTDPAAGEGEFTLEALSPGLRLFAMTFES